MDWERLLSYKRLGDERPPWREKSRSPFEQDQDRITYSTAFRRLAKKTQVFPLPESDVTHNRMTHTLEVAAAGRSLGARVAEGAVGVDQQPLAADVGATVMAACLAHDLGNPPFGHSGEAAISAFFSDGSGRQILGHVDEAVRSDFTRYEGNALGFRLLTRTKPEEEDGTGGMRLTYATLATFLKYPRTSAPNRLRPGRSAPAPGQTHASEKKFCAFADDRAALVEVATALQLPESPFEDRWRRHPFAFLVEAADDICNRAIDLEDAFRVKLVPFEEAEQLLVRIADQGTQGASGGTGRYQRIRDPRQKIGYLRAVAIGVLIEQCAAAFAEHAAAIGDGRFDQPLVERVPAAALVDEIEAMMRSRVYNSRSVLAVEVAGFEVINGLLGILTDALVCHPDRAKSEKVRNLVPASYLAPDHTPHATVYDNLLAATEFVASMTDEYAIDLYRTLTGTQLPNY